MAKELNTKCSICGAPVGKNVRFCSHFCKNVSKNDKALKKDKTKAEKAKSDKKTTAKKDKE